MRLFSGPKRDTQPEDAAPPRWLLPLGVGGLAVGILGRSLGGVVGEGITDLGCVTTAYGAFAFFGLLYEWLYPRKREDR